MLSNRNKKVIDRIKADREAARGTKNKPKWKDIDYLLFLVEAQEKDLPDTFVLEFFDKWESLAEWDSLDDGTLEYIKGRYTAEKKLDERNGEGKRYKYRIVRQLTERREIYKPEDLTD